MQKPQKVSPKVKSFICGTLKNNGYDRHRSARAAYEYRNDPNNPKQRFNPTARYAENWLVAASYNSYYLDLSLNRFKAAIYAWQYLKVVPGVADKNDGFSQEALDAGLDGHEHRYDSPAQLKAMCNVQ